MIHSTAVVIPISMIPEANKHYIYTLCFYYCMLPKHATHISPHCTLTPPLCNIFFLPRLESLKEVYRARQAELRRMEGDVEGAKTSLENLEESSSEKQLKFYRTMTTYAHNMVECLQEKVRKEKLTFKATTEKKE